MPQYHGLEVFIPENDRPHIEYFEQAASGTLHLQYCVECDLMRYPPSPMCSECGTTDYEWQAISGKGTIHSYYFVPHAVNPAFRDWTPYPVILVEINPATSQQGVAIGQTPPRRGEVEDIVLQLHARSTVNGLGGGCG